LKEIKLITNVCEQQGNWQRIIRSDIARAIQLILFCFKIISLEEDFFSITQEDILRIKKAGINPGFFTFEIILLNN